ncbi:MAG TPA: hypothetical protein VMP01_04110 [Pirellulaceae bacterium]|nr:hypothetical protein [Pirellulaceae bacterium]
MSYLLMEIFWIALALGLTWLLIAIDDQFWQINTILLPAVLVVWGVAIGGLVGKMFRGAQFAAAIVRFGIILMLLRALLS